MSNPILAIQCAETETPTPSHQLSPSSPELNDQKIYNGPLSTGSVQLMPKRAIPQLQLQEDPFLCSGDQASEY
jgi:hypothetical protein